MNNNQLVNPSNYDVNNIIFSEPIPGNINSGGPSISFYRIQISSKNNDGSVGDLILPTSRLFSFGVSENTSQETGKVNGWTMPLCLWNRDGPSDQEKKWTDTFDSIVDRCIEHVLDNKESVDKFELEKNDMKKFNPLYWKKEKRMVNGKQTLVVPEGTGPTLYIKLIYSKKNEKFITKMFDVNDNPINPLDMLGKYCYSTSAVKIESIFVGNKISLQVKLYESVIEPIETGMKRLLPRPPANSMVLTSQRNNENNIMIDDGDSSDSSDDDGSLTDDIPSPVKKKTVKRVAKR